MKELEHHIKILVEWFNKNQISYALVGGIAVSFRATERTTKDVDFAIAVDSDLEAEVQIRELISLGYKVDTLLEQSKTKRLATVRLLNGIQDSVYIDLLYSSTGIEKEIVGSAEYIEIFPDLELKVATISSLLAMKVLAASEKRPQDLIDIKELLSESSDSDRDLTKQLLQLIMERGFGRNKDLINDFQDYIERFK